MRCQILRLSGSRVIAVRAHGPRCRACEAPARPHPKLRLPAVGTECTGMPGTLVREQGPLRPA
jgi:hypothetical protein